MKKKDYTVSVLHQTAVTHSIFLVSDVKGDADGGLRACCDWSIAEITNEVPKGQTTTR